MNLAHGLGERSDLPVPLWLALYAGAAAVLIAFFAVSALKPKPRAGREVPLPLAGLADARITRALLRIAGLIAFGVLLAVAWFGADDSHNPAPVWFYVWFWVGLIPASLIFGPFWRLVNPMRPLAAIVRRCLPRGVRRELRSDGAGNAVAVAGMIAFLWLELASAHPDSPRAVALFVTIYTVVHAIGGALFGPRWFAQADAFEMYSGLIAAMSPFGRGSDGRLVLRNPLAGLRSGRAGPGHTALVLAVLGGAMFDGFSGLPLWTDLTGLLRQPVTSVLATAALAVLLVLNFRAYREAIRMTGAYLRPGVSTVDDEFTFPMVPIMVGYGVAHYFSFAVFEGQLGWLLATDPFGRGWDLLGISGASVDYAVPGPAVISAVQVGAIVLGHVVGVVSAHDRALRVVRADDLRSGQYPMVTLMVVYTGIAIVLVSAG
ncbi:hypothetical protein SAMN05421805_101754 [Saccharopolyspora antimicrobica]|uniref:Fenitrothion hydrolase n=1 Tax=Saccharopolyspora antimicrobica TaxID=455193 RepID=A0A1I4RZD6_9PSEU|nr:hypothetical protein [Saccharopolyspora antimicrobica]RKT89198.1 hypothetical protein ATL45_7652 [Saccharopolyspora antimicrobica]SFM57344.1 hypothetical protein SAMN05421805_101754 [Saccharopolyspora antimicrobica]